MFIAVVELARRDAKLVPAKCKGYKHIREAQKALDTAEWFLGHLEYQFKFIQPGAERYNRRRKVRRNYSEITKPIPIWHPKPRD